MQIFHRECHFARPLNADVTKEFHCWQESINKLSKQLLNKLNSKFIHLIHTLTKTDYPGNIKMTKAANAKLRCTLMKHAIATVLPWIREEEKTVGNRKKKRKHNEPMLMIPRI